MDVVVKLHDTRNNFRSTLCVVYHPQIQRQIINQKRCLSNSGHGSRLPEGINEWSLGAPVGNNQQNYAYFTAVWLFTVAHVCKTLGDQTIQSDEIDAGKPTAATGPKRDVVRRQHCHGSTQTMPCHEQPQASQRWNMNHIWHPTNFSQSPWTRRTSAGEWRSWPLFEAGIWMLWVVNNVHVMWHKFKMTKFALKYTQMRSNLTNTAPLLSLPPL